MRAFSRVRAAKNPSAAGADMRPHSARISSGSRQGPSGVHSRPQAPRTQPREEDGPLVGVHPAGGPKHGPLRPQARLPEALKGLLRRHVGGLLADGCGPLQVGQEGGGAVQKGEHVHVLVAAVVVPVHQPRLGGWCTPRTAIARAPWAARSFRSCFREKVPQDGPGFPLDLLHRVEPPGGAALARLPAHQTGPGAGAPGPPGPTCPPPGPARPGRTGGRCVLSSAPLKALLLFLNADAVEKVLGLQKLYIELLECGRIHVGKNQNRGLSTTTVHSVHLMLHCALDRAVKERLIPRNPCEGLHCTQAPKAGNENPAPGAYKSLPGRGRGQRLVPHVLPGSWSAACGWGNW